MFFDNVSGLVRVLVVAPLAYVWLVAVLRCSGKRTLAELNAFDFIVTVALGSTLATVALSTTVPIAETLQADEEIALPVSRNSTVLCFGGALADQRFGG